MIPHREPTTLAEMHARKKAADERQAQAAALLRARTDADRAAAGAPAAAQPAPEPAEVLPPSPPGPFDPAKATIHQIVAHVAAGYGLTRDDILGESRVATVVTARRAAMGAVHQAKPHLSLPQIGKAFRRDHTTVLHALRELGLAAPASEPVTLAANATDAGGKRAIAALPLPDLRPAEIAGAAPEYRMVDPRTLQVDAGYQRDLSKQSLTLIRRIVEQWSWRAFKPPIVVEADGVLDVIDGQHTAIAAATHPGLALIPVMVVEAARRSERADAFVRHNRDRIRMSGQQMYFGLLAAGDREAVAVEAVCRETGAHVLRGRPNAASYRPGETMAVETLLGILRHRGPAGLTRVVSTCVRARLTPIRSHELWAVEDLLFAPDHGGAFDEAGIAAILRNLGPDAERQAAVHAAQYRVPMWRALAITLARAPKRMRRPDDGADAA